MTSVATSAPAELILLVLGAVALMLLVLFLKRTHPNHQFFLQLLDSLGRDIHGNPREETGNGGSGRAGELPDLDGADR